MEQCNITLKCDNLVQWFYCSTTGRVVSGSTVLLAEWLVEGEELCQQRTVASTGSWHLATLQMLKALLIEPAVMVMMMMLTVMAMMIITMMVTALSTVFHYVIVDVDTDGKDEIVQLTM